MGCQYDIVSDTGPDDYPTYETCTTHIYSPPMLGATAIFINFDRDIGFLKDQEEMCTAKEHKVSPLKSPLHTL